MTLKVRPSEIKLFKRCRRQWEIKYVHGIGLKDSGLDEPGAARVGTMVHSALETYYKGDDHTLYWPEPGTFNDDQKLARIMVDGYLEWLEETGADDGLVVEAAELELEVPWPWPVYGEDIVLVGHIDLLATDNHGIRKLIDHKTVMSLEQYARQLSVDSQMLTYAVMLKMQGIEIGGAIHNALRRVKRTAAAKPPFYARNEVTYGLEQLRSHARQIDAVLQDMVTCRRAVEGGLHDRTYPSPSRDCTWDCPHLSLCPTFDDGSNIDTILTMMKSA